MFDNIWFRSHFFIDLLTFFGSFRWMILFTFTFLFCMCFPYSFLFRLLFTIRSFWIHNLLLLFLFMLIFICLLFLYLFWSRWLWLNLRMNSFRNKGIKLNTKSRMSIFDQIPEGNVAFALYNVLIFFIFFSLRLIHKDYYSPP